MPDSDLPRGRPAGPESGPVRLGGWGAGRGRARGTKGVERRLRRRRPLGSLPIV